MASAEKNSNALLDVVRERAAHLRHIDPAAEGSILTDASAMMQNAGSGRDTAITVALRAREAELVERHGCEDLHHLLARFHPLAREPLVQSRLVAARARRLTGKAVWLEALRSVGVDVAEHSLRRDCAAPIRFTSSPAVAMLDADRKRAEDVGDQVGEARVDKATAEALSRYDEARQGQAVEAAPLPHVSAERPADAGPAEPLHAGALEMLLSADLTTTEGADRLFCAISTADGMRASLEELRTAQGIARFIQAAIVSGYNRPNWELVARLAKAVQSDAIKRRDVVVLLEDLLDWHARDEQFRRDFPNVQLPEDDTLPARARITLQHFARLDGRFLPEGQELERVSALVALICGEDRVTSATGIAARLSLRCGAFGDEKRPNESDVEAQDRVKNLYADAVRKVPVV